MKLPRVQKTHPEHKDTENRVLICQAPNTDVLQFLYPEINGTDIAESASRTIGDLAPVCQPNPLNLIGTPGSFAVVRGSAMKRVYFGVPASYWDVSRVWKTVDTHHLEPVTKKVVETNAKGPRDYDVRFCLKPALPLGAVRDTLTESLIEQGFVLYEEGQFRKDRYTASLTEKQMGANGSSRLFFGLTYQREGQTVLHLDMGELPQTLDPTTNLWDDNRLHEIMPAMDWVLTGSLFQKQGQTSLEWKKFPLRDQDRYAFTLGLHSIPKEQYYAAFVQAFTSAFSTNVFWPASSYMQSVIGLRMRIVELEEYANNGLGRAGEASQEKLSARQADLTSKLLASLTFDLPHALQLLFDTYFARTLPIGTVVQSNAQLARITRHLWGAIAEVDMPPLRSEEFYLYLDYVSYLYRLRLMQSSSPQNLGIDLLSTSLVDAGIVEQRDVDTIEKQLGLVNPALTNITSIIR